MDKIAEEQMRAIKDKLPPGFPTPPGYNYYIGPRFILKFADPIEWDANTQYEPMIAVMYQGNSYISRTYVPAGVVPTNEEYWAPSGMYNAQIEQYRREVQEFDGRITDVENGLETIEEGLNDFNTVKVGHLGSEEGLLLGGKSFSSKDGLLLSTDGNTSWGYMQSSKYGSKTELSIQSRIYLGFCTVANGVVTYLSGTKFKTNLPLFKIWIDNTLYDIESYVSETQINLVDKTVNKTNVFYQFINEYAQGTVSTSGNTVTYIDGDNFAYWWVNDNIFINNNRYTVASVTNNGRTIKTIESLPNQNSVPFQHFGSYNDVATIGINKSAGENEERIVLTAKASGEYRFSTVATGRGKHYPIYFDVSNLNAIKINTNGTTDFKYPITAANPNGNASIGVISDCVEGYLITNPQNKSVILYSDTEIFTAYTGNHSISFGYIPQIPILTKATLPTNVPSGSIAICNDASPAVPVWYDGTNWVRFNNEAI